MNDSFKLALITANPDRFIPVIFPQETSEEVTDEDVLDTEPTEWKFTEQVDPADAEAMLADLMAQAASPMTQEDVDRYSAEQDPDW